MANKLVIRAPDSVTLTLIYALTDKDKTDRTGGQRETDGMLPNVVVTYSYTQIKIMHNSTVHSIVGLD